jgi:AhpD family alkylhydroperoxidase
MKELMAVVVSKAANCDYCTDTHMVFLQAAGMDRAKAFEIEAKLGEASTLLASERLAVSLATRLTVSPREVTEEELREFAAAWPDREELVELVSVIASFNMITRIANALGVSLEIPTAIRRFESGRRGAISLLSRLTAVSLDLSARSLQARTPEENRAALQALFDAQLGFPSLPPGFQLLEHCPEIFDGQLRTMERAVAVVPRDRWMRVGLVVARLTGCEYFSTHCAAWLERRGIEPADVIAASEGAGAGQPDAEDACIRFARDMTLHSHTISESRIDELRNFGLSDGAILDLTYVAGVLNGMVRIVAALGPLEESLSA